MGETISLDDYTTLPGNSGATHSISLCIAVTPVRAQNVQFILRLVVLPTWVSSLPGRPNHPRIQSSNAENWSPGSRGCQAPLEVCSPCAWAMCFDASDSEVAAVVVAVGHAMRPRKTGLTRL